LPDITELNISDYSEYFEASKHLRTITTYDALNNPLTSEFAESYLKPLGINSMMDVPIWVRGRIFGVICFEQIGAFRDWSADDQSFAASVAEVISRAIETNHSRQKEAEYEESQRFLTTLISNLPGYVYRCSERNGQWFVEYASEGIFELTGFRSEDMLSDQNLYSTLVHPDDSDIQARVVLDSIRSKKPYQITYRIHTADGREKWVWEQGRGVYSSEGHLIATEGFITEITEKKKVEEELINRNIELSILNQIGQSLSRLAEPREIIEILFTTIGRLFDASNFYLALIDENRKMLTFPIYIVKGDVKDVPAKRFENGIPEYVIDTKKPILLNGDLAKGLKELGIIQSDNDLRAIMAAPLLAGDKVIGVMTLQNYHQDKNYGESQLEILTTIASQAGIALQNARLYDEVKKSLGEKDVLLQEVHHRVKNNLQIMSSLVKLQSQHIKDPATREILKESENRIRSMAIVHTKLYNSRDYESIDFGDYVRSLTESFYTTYGMRLNRIRIDIEIRDIILNIDTAIPCGLIINELVSNAIKHAFPDIKDGKITISLLANKDHSYTMQVKDNGIGLPAGFDPRTSKTLGIELVTLLTNQLNGKLEYNTNGGTEFIITFEESRYKERA
jgi:PAS domain S-box-containing protein